MPPTVTQSDSRRWASLADGAEYLGVCERTCRRLINSGHITGYRAGPRLIRVDLNELDAMMRPIPASDAA
jgi:excisionase family DNA binding protein